MTQQLHLETISFSYQNSAILSDISMTLEQGEIGCILGQSGSGKSTLLRLIAGFLPLKDGKITVGNRCISSGKIHLAPHHRNIGFVFQDWALFPHLSVEDNIKFGLSTLSRSEKEHRCLALAKQFQIQPFLKRFPHELSGGQQQRVAIARALAPEPSLVLMDEPFSNLDTVLKEELTLSLKSAFKTLGTTVLWVTHDPETALVAADHIGKLDQGKLTWWNSAESFCQANPDFKYVAGDLFNEENPVLIKRLSSSRL